MNDSGSADPDIAAAMSLVRDLYVILPRIAKRVSLLSEQVDYHDVGKGYRWEKEFCEMATVRGLHVAPPTDSKHDCRVNGKRVQCKRVDNITGNICTTPILGRSYLGYSVSDWDVLAMKQMSRFLLIPSAAMVLEDGERLVNQIKPGEWTEWVDRWDVFGDDVVIVRHTQRHLFG